MKLYKVFSKPASFNKKSSLLYDIVIIFDRKSNTFLTNIIAYHYFIIPIFIFISPSILLCETLIFCNSYPMNNFHNHIYFSYFNNFFYNNIQFSLKSYLSLKNLLTFNILFFSLIYFHSLIIKINLYH